MDFMRMQNNSNENRPAAIRTVKRRVPSKTMRESASQMVIYMHPAAAKALKLYAAENDTKVHELLIDALQTWFKLHGLNEPVRVETLRTLQEKQN